jgi:hypothetical protein
MKNGGNTSELWWTLAFPSFFMRVLAAGVAGRRATRWQLRVLGVSVVSRHGGG